MWVPMSPLRSLISLTRAASSSGVHSSEQPPPSAGAGEWSMGGCKCEGMGEWVGT